jgi:hypothetical protein
MRTAGKGKIYGDRATKVMRGFISQLANWHRQAKEFGMTSEWISERIETHVYQTDIYKRLSDREISVFFEMRNQMFLEWQRGHIWTHVINGKRLAQGHPEIEKNYEQLNVPMEQSLSCHCQGYLIPGESNRIVWVPIEQKDIDSDIKAGRLMTDHLNMIRSAADNKRTPRVSMVYNHELQVTVSVKELTTEPWQLTN